MELDPKDLSIETISNGSSWFPKFSGIRITHIPTRIYAESKDCRSQHQNKHEAMTELSNRVEIHYFYLKLGTIKETEQKQGLRALRLYHWNQFIKLGQWASRHENTSPQYNRKEVQRKAQLFREWSNFHIKQVQLLNDFFSIDDTAEQDALKQRPLQA